jgi:hypothetical protein
MEIEKWDLLNLFQENNGGGEFNYDVFDIL